MLQIPFTLCYVPELAASDNLTRTDSKLQIRGVAPLSKVQGKVKCGTMNPLLLLKLVRPWLTPAANLPPRHPRQSDRQARALA